MSEQPDASSVIRSEQRLRVGNEWVTVERVRVRRRILTEYVLVPVTIRREELVIEQEPIADPVPADDSRPGPAGRPPLVITLHEEVPVVSLDTWPYERVTFQVELVRGTQVLRADLDREVIEVDATDRGT